MLKDGTKKRYAVIVSLVLIIAISWFYAASTFSKNKSDIILALDDIISEISFPYKLMRISMKDTVENLPVPVYGVSLSSIDDTWGTAREEGRTHEGVDIFAERGTPVFSATEGYVVRTNIGTRGGSNVMIFGPSGIYYYYAHFSRLASGIERGVYVTKDSVLGFVGNSGNAEGTPHHLHFGIYPEQWDAVNPYPMLVSR